MTTRPGAAAAGRLYHRPAATGPAFWGPGDHYTFLVTGEESGGAYFAMEALVPPGGGPPPHIHTREDETFYVLEGSIEFLLGDDLRTAGPGDFVNVPRGTVHRFLNTGTETARLILTFTPAGLEKWFEETLERAPNTFDEVRHGQGRAGQRHDDQHDARCLVDEREVVPGRCRHEGGADSRGSDCEERSAGPAGERQERPRDETGGAERDAERGAEEQDGDGAAGRDLADDGARGGIEAACPPVRDEHQPHRDPRRAAAHHQAERTARRQREERATHGHRTQPEGPAAHDPCSEARLHAPDVATDRTN